MKENVDDKVIKFIEVVKEHPDILNYQVLQNSLLQEKDLLQKIQMLQILNKEDPVYREMKQELFQNKMYREYLSLEQKIQFWTYEMSKKLKELIRNEKDESN